MKNENGEILEVHPYAARFPLMNDEELEYLAEDIKANGLKSPLIRDQDGTLIDGRNRLAACKIAEIEPSFVELNGDQDPVVFIISVNINRRHLSTSQKAMALAFAYPEPKRGRGNKDEAIKGAETAGFSYRRLAMARQVLNHSRELALEVLSGAKSLDAALAIIIQQQKERESDEAKFTRLQKYASDLADQVTEEKLSLAEAIGALEVREKEKAIAEKDAQDQRVERANNLHMILGTLAIGPTPSDHKAELALDIDWPTFAFMNKGITKKDWLKAGKTLSEIVKLWDDDYAKH